MLRWWTPGLALSQDPISSIPVWVQFFGVPLEFWTAESLSHIASAVGSPLYADAQTEQCTRLKYARICVEVAAGKPLLEELFLKTSAKGDCPSCFHKIKVVYQWRPKQCSTCQVFGHSDSACHNRLVPSRQEVDPLGRSMGPAKHSLKVGI